MGASRARRASRRDGAAGGRSLNGASVGLAAERCLCQLAIFPGRTRRDACGPHEHTLAIASAVGKPAHHA
jgi:hypothetical protein